MGRYLRGFARFDQEEFWEACMELDLLWREEPSEYCQGLIFLAAGFWHLQCQNSLGCQKLLELAVEYLAPYAYINPTSAVADAVRQAVAITRLLRTESGGGHGWGVTYPKLRDEIQPSIDAA